MNQLLSFRLLWISQSIANLGDSLYILAIVTIIYNSTGSAVFAGLFPILRVCLKGDFIACHLFLNPFPQN